ncbi:MAG: Stk1 family PASTA domain-containing Ser/Thr kinase [Ruminococcaceae bacterium]|nr:Stk1 family PASTA domain-containing Ser/Thr kinase [Oscillospiraceae bacterium]
MKNLVGSVLNDRYSIVEIVGIGGMAVVYKAVDNLENRFVAVKILKDEFVKDERFRRRFLNESRAIAMLSHKNIVDVYDVNFEGDIQYIVMEFIEGRTLKEYIEVTGAISASEAIGYCKQILSALRHAHERGVIHRDIKPHNIMLLDDGTVKVTDFGIAHVSNFETITMTDTAIGSVHYISPEQARGLTTDEKSDIYSTGVMLYEMATGQLPFTAETPVSVALMQVQQEPQPPREINPNIPEGLEQIILKAMQKDPNRRYLQAKEFLIDLKILEDNRETVFDYKFGPAAETPKEDEKTTELETPAQSEKPKASNNTKKSPAKKKRKKKTARQYRMARIRNKFLSATAGIFLGAILALLGYGVMDMMVHQFNEDLVDIPSLVGKIAEDVINDPVYIRNFVFETEEVYDNTIGAGMIVEQNPSEGQYAAGTTIELKVSKGKREVQIPDVVNWEKAQAQLKLRQADLIVEIIQIQSSTVEEGFVIKTEPAVGLTVPVSTTVKLYVSYSSEMGQIYMPSVVGLKKELAVTALYQESLYPIIREEYNDEVKAGFVISQSVEKDTIIDKGSDVIIYVSKGSIDEAIANGTYVPES